MISWNRILVPTDFSETSAAAVKEGVALARTFNASLILMHVGYDVTSFAASEFPLDLDEGVLAADREHLLKTLTPLQQAGLDVEFVTSAGNPAQQIVRCALEREADVIVMGTHGRGGVSHVLLGSVAEKVVRTAPCPVLVIRAPLNAIPETEFAVVAVTAQ